MGNLFPLYGNNELEFSRQNQKFSSTYVSLALIWCQNFQDWAIPVEGDTWPSLKIGNFL